jgi:hypothetical protein
MGNDQKQQQEQQQQEFLDFCCQQDLTSPNKRIMEIEFKSKNDYSKGQISKQSI